MRFLATHKKQALLITIALVVFIIFSVFSFIHVHQNDDLAGEEETSEMSEDEIAAADAEAKLTDEQISLRNTYDDDTENLIGLLCSSDWMVDDQLPSLTFTANYYTETISDTNQSVVAYVVSDLYMESSSDGNTFTEVYNAVLETSDGNSSLIKLTCTKNTKDASTAFTLAGSGFAKSWEEYDAVTTHRELTIEGLNADIQNYLGEDVDNLKSELASYCASYAPTAGTASWNKNLYIDYEEGLLTTYFTLDDRSMSVLTVVFNMSDRSFGISE